jgi:hypothetical protein
MAIDLLPRQHPSPAGMAHALHSCSELRTELGAQGLACLAASSKCIKAAVEEAVVCDRRSLLTAALNTAWRTKFGRSALHLKAAAWLAALLLRQAPNIVEEVTGQVLMTPKVSLKWAQQLVSAGMRINYAQLLSAANSLVAGVEVWVRAQDSLHIQSDIPAAALAICCSRRWVGGASFVILRQPPARVTICTLQFVADGCAAASNVGAIGH